MVPLLKVLGTFLVGFVALVSLFSGWMLWLPLAVDVGAKQGGLWQLGAFAGLLAGNVAVAAGLWRLQDALTRRVDFRGRALAERLYCQRCGAALPATAPACDACGTVRLGLTPPVRRRAPAAAHGHPALREP
jgi:ribosomal protein L40E